MDSLFFFLLSFCREWTLFFFLLSFFFCLFLVLDDRGVRHGASRRTRFRNPLDFTWISDFRLDFWISRGFLDFKVDFWISKWISGFHVDFRISKWISTFWILFEELLFVIPKILLISKPSQPGCTQNTMS